MSDKASNTAMEIFNKGAQQMNSEEEVSEYCQMLCCMAIKVIHGIHGQKFKKDFLRGAIKDDEKITIARVQ